MVDITEAEKNKEEKNENKWGQSQRPLGQFKCTNIQITGVSEEEEKKKVYEKNFEEIIVENIPSMEKEIVKSKRHKESHTG